MTEPRERGRDLRLRAGRARAESARLHADALRAERKAAQLAITAHALVGQALVVYLEGALDMASTPLVVGDVAAQRATGGMVRIDLAGVDFLDAHGLRALLELTSADAPASGRVELARPSRAVLRVVEITGTADCLGLGRFT